MGLSVGHHSPDLVQLSAGMTDLALTFAPALTIQLHPTVKVAMDQGASESHIQSPTSTTLQLIRSAQIEHQGQYSTQRLCALHDYNTNKFTAWRLAALLLVTPLPSIMIVVSIELAPLNPPSAGTYDNTVFWARFALVNFINASCYIIMAHVVVRLLDLTIMQGLLTAICATIISIVTAYLLATQISFPVPFGLLICSVPGVWAMMMVMAIISFRRILANPSAAKSLKEWFNVSGLAFTQMFLYPLYNHLFQLASPWSQTALSIVLGFVKIWYRFAVGKIVKEQADRKAEIVTFNAEVGHAMFVAFTMQNATSIMTVVVLLVVDVLHASAMIYDVHVMVKRLDSLDRAIRKRKRDVPRGTSVVDCALQLILFLQPEEELTLRGTGLIQTGNHPNSRHLKLPHLRGAKVHAAPSMNTALLAGPSATNGIAPTRPDPIVNSVTGLTNKSNPILRNATETKYTATTLQLLHLTEFIMLGELVEVIVPIVYTSYMTAMIRLPNRIYCPQLATVSVETIDSTALRMLSYGLLELVTLITIDLILRMRLGFSPTAQLAMVLESHWASVQAGFVVWVVYTVQGLILHFGADFSFQFAWLHRNETNTSKGV